MTPNQFPSVSGRRWRVTRNSRLSVNAEDDPGSMSGIAGITVSRCGRLRSITLGTGRKRLYLGERKPVPVAGMSEPA